MAGNLAAIWSGLGVTALSQTTLPPDLHMLPDNPSLPPLGSVTVGLYWTPRGASEVTRQLAGFLLQVLNSRLETV